MLTVDNVFVPLPDSMPPLDTESQRSVVVIDSQGVTSEPGPGAQRDLLVKAEQNALVADARANVARAEPPCGTRRARAVGARRQLPARGRRRGRGRQRALLDAHGGRPGDVLVDRRLEGRHVRSHDLARGGEELSRLLPCPPCCRRHGSPTGRQSSATP